MDSSAPHLSSPHAISLTTIAGKPAPTGDRVRVAQAAAICNLPKLIAQVFADNFGLTCHAPPVDIPEPELVAYWHTRYDADPGLMWLRERVKQSILTL